MYLRKIHIVLVCLVFYLAVCAANAQAWNFKLAAANAQQDLYAPKSPHAKLTPKPLEGQKTKTITKVKPSEKITKCKPDRLYGVQAPLYGPLPPCILPIARPKGWEMNASLFFARTKGKVRFARGAFGYQGLVGFVDDIDLNDDMSLPEHGYIPEFSATYRFRPNWSLRYSIMPMVMEASGYPHRSFVFGNHTYNTAQTTKVKWERVLHRVGMVYEPVRTYTSRISVFGDYVRIDDKLTLINPNCCGDTMDTDLNMGMAGIEFEKCLKTGRLCNTLSLECMAGVAFGDEAFGSDVMTGVKYSIPMNNGRWGYVKGGYRFSTYKKKFSDVRMIDTAMEGAVLQMGFVF